MADDWYDVINTWGPSDDYYLALVLQAASVLDVGCGTGALLARARDSGHTGRLCGLDPDDEGLAVARRRTDVEWITGTAAEAPWRNEFDLAVMTGHAFQELITDDDVHDSLTAIHRTLTTNGHFAFETRNPTARAWDHWTPENGTDVTNEDGVTIRVEHHSNLVGDVVEISETFTGPPWPEPLVNWGKLRFLSEERLDNFLEEAGFTLVKRYGDWNRTPVTPTSKELITVVKRA